MSDFENMDVILGSDHVNPIERELSIVIGNSASHCDNESNLQSRENESRENDFGHYVHENIIPGRIDFKRRWKLLLVSLMRLSQEMDSMMSMMHNQIKSYQHSNS